ncbi:FG-GAP repeat protein [Dokdonella sp.]|uniref:FG-GAP repeat protein n=1 Tax=Dokdonella sp. TaxID=2291710 RepID=UPI002F3FEB9C
MSLVLNWSTPSSRLRGALAAFALCAFATVSPAPAADYALRQELGAIASGEGSPGGVFGYSVAIDGDIAVAADLGIPTRPGKVRTYVRSNGEWVREAGHDVDLPGDSSAMLSLREGTLAISAFDSATSRSYVQIFEHTPTAWQLGYSVSTQSAYFDRVATSGNIVVAGEPGYDGAAGQNQGRIRIFRRNGDSWSSTNLLPSTPHAGALFGASVAIVAGAIVVGAPRETVGGYAEAGAAYVYELPIDTWDEVAHLVQSAGDLTGNRFSSAVAISGADPSTPDRLLVSSPSNAGTGRSGRVHSFTRTNGVWTARTVLQAPSPSATDGWGCALALDGSWAAIGQCDSGAQAAGAGAIEMVRFTSSFTSVAAVSVDTDPFGDANEHLGYRIDVDRSGPTLIAGNAGAAMYGNAAQGVVLFGAWGNETLSLARELDLGQGLSGARASTLASDGDTLFVGAPQEDVGLQQERGAVYVYRRAGAQYAFESRILAPDGMAGDYFGSRIALQGDVALVSAIGRTQGDVDAAGAVYAFHRDGATWSLERQFLPVAPGYEEEFGEGVAFDAGTAMISNRHDSTFVYTRADTGTWTPVQTIDHVGWPVRLEGDTAMLAYFGANADVGEIGVYARVGGSWQLQDTLDGSLPGQGLGIDASLRGDWFAAASNNPAVPVQLYRRTPGGWLPEASLLPEDATPDTWCWHVAMSAATLAIGCSAPGNAGAVYLFEKTAGLWTQQQKLELPDPVAGDAFGFTLDFHADSTLFAGALGRDLEFTDQGAVYVWTGERLFADGFD